MRRIVLSAAVLLVSFSCLLATEVEVSSSPKPKPSGSPKPKQQQQPQHTTTPAPSTTPVGELPLYRPALLGTGPNSVINRIDTQDLIKKGQKDGSILFCCSVRIDGEIANVWTYHGTPESLLLEQELTKRLDEAVFIPAIYNHRPVHVLFLEQ